MTQELYLKIKAFKLAVMLLPKDSHNSASEAIRLAVPIFRYLYNDIETTADFIVFKSSEEAKKFIQKTAKEGISNVS